MEYAVRLFGSLFRFSINFHTVCKRIACIFNLVDYTIACMYSLDSLRWPSPQQDFKRILPLTKHSCSWITQDVTIFGCSFCLEFVFLVACGEFSLFFSSLAWLAQLFGSTHERFSSCSLSEFVR